MEESLTAKWIELKGEPAVSVSIAHDGEHNPKSQWFNPPIYLFSGFLFFFRNSSDSIRKVKAFHEIMKSVLQFTTLEKWSYI